MIWISPLLLFLLTAADGAPNDGLLCRWSFDGDNPLAVRDSAGRIADRLEGHFKRVEGVGGMGLKFDGATTRVVRQAEEAPWISGAFTVSAWVAPQEYPWNWCAVANRMRGREAGWFFGLDHVGRVGLCGAVNGAWKACISGNAVPLHAWSHIAGAFDEARGFTVYINGRAAGHRSSSGRLTPAEDADLLLGMSQEKMFPMHTERAPSRKMLSFMVFDGIIDEVRIFGRALTAREIEQAFQREKPVKRKPLSFRTMPSGPTGPASFGAAQGRLWYCDEWENLWPVGPHPDIVVRFDTSPVKLVFWRGISYGPAWVSENGLWMGDQSLESGSDFGCNEHMSDKQCRYSHVRLIENHDARVVVHWRYALCDIRYAIVNPDESGFGDWADEYYFIYPDAVAVRKQVLWSSKFGENWHQFQETILFNQPGFKPEDTVELAALTLANVKGETHTYTWENGYPPAFGKPADATIQRINFKSRYRPFTIFETGSGIWPFHFGALEGYSTFPCWNHWPVAQLPNDGRNAPAPDRPSHTSLTGGNPVIRAGEGISRQAVYLYGMTDRPTKELAPLARSWNEPPALAVLSGGYASKGYDKTERAYVLACNNPGRPDAAIFEIAATEASPLVNPAFVIRNFGEGTARLAMNGAAIPAGPVFRSGHRHTLEGSDLILWLGEKSTGPVVITITPADG